ncbi:hypothetical protein JCM5296_002942 [Sporobolomyces johnsonii]
MSIPSTTSHSQRRRVPSSARPPSASSAVYQPFPSPDALSSAPPLPDHPPDSLLRARPHNAAFLPSPRDRTSSYSARSTGKDSKPRGPASWETASESGMSGMTVLSAFPDAQAKAKRRAARKEREARRLLEREEDERRRVTTDEGDPTGSPLRRWVKWMLASGQKRDRWATVLVALAAIVLVRWCAGLGGYSGYATPPLRGDFEAQRHWLSLTSSSLSSRTHLSLPFLPLRIPLYHPPSPPSSSTPVPTSSWYSHDLSYWGLDYPPLTAYHSFLLGLVARLSPSSARFVTLRPDSRVASDEELAAWEANMSALEGAGDMRNWMRASVIVGDVLLWVSAVAWYCWKNFAGGGEGSRSARRGASEKGLRRTLVPALTILLQPALILIDNGHFQYNSIMLALTLWAINAFQAGHDLLGSILFVCSLGFKQMALYYAPGVFAYLFGKCLWLGGRDGLNLFLHLGLTVALAFTALFLPFLTPFPHALFQALERIFPFSRGLFEDKVANAWCALNVVVKLREVASVPVLARLALGVTVLAVLPSTAGVVYLSRKLGREKHKDTGKAKDQDRSRRPISLEPSSGPAPTSHLLPHLLFLSSLSFFLFSFQVHEKSILLPLMPLTLLMGGREAGYGRMDWEWGVLINNVAVFSMYPLLKRDGLQTHYLAVTLLWNFLIGYDPLSLRPGSFVKLLSLTSYTLIVVVHALEALTDPPAHLPDLFAVLNLTLSAGVFGVGWLWASKRLGQEGWALGGLGRGGR